MQADFLLYYIVIIYRMKIFLVLLILFFTACAIQPTYRELYENAEGRYAQIYASEQYLGNTFYYGTNKKDTIIFVSSKDVPVRDEQSAGLYIAIAGLRKIPRLITDNDTLHFIYRMKAASPLTGYILCGDGPPGKIKNSLYTYGSLPFEIKSGKSFIRKK